MTRDGATPPRSSRGFSRLTPSGWGRSFGPRLPGGLAGRHRNRVSPPESPQPRARGAPNHPTPREGTMSTRREPVGRWLVRGAVAGVLALGTVLPAAAQTTITMWSHEADEPAKVAWREKAAKNFEA